MARRAALRRCSSPFSPGCVYLGFVAVDFAVSLHAAISQTIQWIGTLAGRGRRTHVPRAAVPWSWLSGRRTRAELARLVVELSGAPSRAGLEQALARSLGDPGRAARVPARGRPLRRRRRRRVDPAGTALRWCATALRSRSSPTSPVCSMTRVVEAVTATAASRSKRAPARGAPRSSRRPARLTCRIVAAGDPSAAGSSATSTTAPSSGSSLSCSRWAPPHAASNPAQTRPEMSLVSTGGPGAARGPRRAPGADQRHFPAVLADEGLAPAVEALAEEHPGTDPDQRAPRPAVRPRHRVRRLPSHLQDGQARPPSPSHARRLQRRAARLEPRAPGRPTGSRPRRPARRAGGTLELSPRRAAREIRAEIPCAS